MNEYAPDKLTAYPGKIAMLRDRRDIQSPISVHLMPQNASNQRIPPGPIQFDESKCLPFDKVLELFDDFDAMGVQHVEVTGGGEPLAYPETQKIWEQMVFHDFTTALVTNGTLLRGRAAMIARTKLKSVVVVIGGMTAGEYSRRHCVPEHHFDKAWQAVRELAQYVAGTVAAEWPTYSGAECVIEGAGNVYHHGRFVGNFITHARGFRGVWEGR